MEEFFKHRINYLNNKIESWNKKNFFQKIFAAEKWSNEDTCDEVEKIFQVDTLDQIRSKEDFDIYMKYFLKYHKALSAELSNTIVERLLLSNHLTPQVEILLKQFLEASLEKQYHYNQAMDIINSIK